MHDDTMREISMNFYGDARTFEAAAKRLRDPGLIRRHRPQPAFSNSTWEEAYPLEPETVEEREARHTKRRELLLRLDAAHARATAKLDEAQAKLDEARAEVEAMMTRTRERLVAEIASA